MLRRRERQPFHKTVNADEIRRTHDKKVQRMAGLRTAMRAMLADSARSLDSVPSDEQLAVSVALFYWNWENREGLPAQIVMHAPRKASAGGECRTGAYRVRRVLSDASG